MASKNMNFTGQGRKNYREMLFFKHSAPRGVNFLSTNSITTQKAIIKKT